MLFKGFGRASAQSSPLLKMPRKQMQTFSFRAAFMRSVHARHTFLLGCLAFGSRLPYVSIGMFCVRFTPAVCRVRAKQDGLRYLAFLFRRGSRSPFVCSRIIVRLSGLVGSLRVCSFIYGDPDGVTGDTRNGERGTGERGWRRSVSALLRNHIGFAMFSAGSTLGLRAPDCAKESKVEAALPPLWTLFTLRRGCLGAYSQRLCAFAQPHQPC